MALQIRRGALVRWQLFGHHANGRSVRIERPTHGHSALGGAAVDGVVAGVHGGLSEVVGVFVGKGDGDMES